MPRRIDVELTSARDDGTWTWRAAGARQPKGVVGGDVLYQGAKVGDIVRAEVEMDVDGITILSVTPPKGKSGPPQGLLEVIGPQRDFEGVTSSLVPKTDRPRRDRRDRPPRSDGDRPARRDGPRPDRAAGPRGEVRGDRPDRGERRPRPDRAARGAGPQRSDRDDRGDRGDRAARDRRPGAPEPSGRPRPKRLNPANVHRAAVLETLQPEQRAIAEQVLRGGIPAVRRAIDEQNAKAREEGLPEVKTDPLLAVAEELLPRLKTAEWRDRAEAAAADVDEIGLRDLRSVVSGSDANARDDDTRKLAVSLREALDRRLNEERDEWTKSIVSALEENRLVRALRVSTRPPDPSMRLPSDIAMRLSGAASEALAPDAPADRWAALLEAVVASPVRTTVKPAGLPEPATDALREAARQASGRIPALAQLLGLALPPPPAAVKKGAPGRRVPPPPPRRPPAPPAERPAPAAAAAEPPAPAEAPEPSERSDPPDVPEQVE